MKKLDIYIIKKFFGTFFLSLGLLIIIVIVFDISENIGDFLENDAPLKAIIFDYYLNFIPYFANLFSYLFVFISVIFFTSKMASNSEIIAIFSSGISFMRFLRPYITVAVFLAVLSYIMGNFIIPVTDAARVEFKKKYIRNKVRSTDRNIHFQIKPGGFVYVYSFDVDRAKARRFSLEQFDGNKLVYKLQSRRALWDSTKKSWRIQNYFVREWKDGKEKFYKGKVLDTVIPLSPEDFIHHKDEINEMTLFDLNRAIAKEKLKGSPLVTKLEIEKQKRIAFPFATIIMTLIGVSIASKKRRSGMGLHLGMGLAFAFTYIFFMQISTVLSMNTGISPAIAVWIPNLIYTAIAFVLIRFAQK